MYTMQRMLFYCIVSLHSVSLSHKGSKLPNAFSTQPTRVMVQILTNNLFVPLDQIYIYFDCVMYTWGHIKHRR